MKYNNGLARDEFLQHLYETFPSVFNNAFSREMLDNIVDYGMNNHIVTKNDLYYYLKDMIPDVDSNDLIPYIDEELLTEEVLALVDNEISFNPGYYEWNVFVGDDCVYTFGDLSEMVVDEDGKLISADELVDVVDSMLDYLNPEMEEAGEKPFSKEQLESLKEKMFNRIQAHYGISEKAESDITLEERLVSAIDRSDETETHGASKNNIEFEKE